MSLVEVVIFSWRTVPWKWSKLYSLKVPASEMWPRDCGGSVWKISSGSQQGCGSPRSSWMRNHELFSRRGYPPPDPILFFFCQVDSFYVEATTDQSAHERGSAISWHGAVWFTWSGELQTIGAGADAGIRPSIKYDVDWKHELVKTCPQPDYG